MCSAVYYATSHYTTIFFIQNYQNFSKWVSDTSKLNMPEPITTLSLGVLGLDTALWQGRLDARGGRTTQNITTPLTQAPRNKQQASSYRSEH